MRTNFVVAVWATIALGCGFLASMHPSTYMSTHPGARAPIGLALLVVFELGLWFYTFRADEGYAAAATVGLVLIQPAVAAVFIPQVSDTPLSVPIIVGSLYLALSHFAYAFVNWRKSTQSWLDL